MQIDTVLLIGIGLLFIVFISLVSIWIYSSSAEIEFTKEEIRLAAWELLKEEKISDNQYRDYIKIAYYTRSLNKLYKTLEELNRI